jgi:hypothetical protein
MKSVLKTSITAFAIILLLVTSCKKTTVKDLGVHTYEFSAADKRWFFYNVGDSLHYVNNYNEKLTYVVTETKEIKCPGYATTWRDFDNALSFYESHYFITLKAVNAPAFGNIEIEAVKTIPNISLRANPPRVEGVFSIEAEWANWNDHNRNRTIRFNTNETGYEDVDSHNTTIKAAVNVTANFIVNAVGYNPVIKTYYAPAKGLVKFLTFDGNVWTRTL